MNELIAECRARHIRNAIGEGQGDPKRLANIVQGVLGRQQSSSSLPRHVETQDLVEDFSAFFQAKVTNIRNTFGNVDTSISLPSVNHETADGQLKRLSATNDAEIIKLVKDSPNKTCSLDSVPTWIVKECIEILAPALTSLVNTSISEADFPPELKHALVTPILKKNNLDKDNLNNYRPVSNLSFISKLIEKVVACRFREHLDTNRLYPKFQSAYRKLHGTESALLRVHHDIIQHIDRGNCVALVLLDLSAAFDTIDHALLLTTLENEFGITQSALQWISTYMTFRSQSVRIDPGVDSKQSSCGASMSTPVPLTCGVPQGSILGPLLFTLYISPLSDIIASHGVQYHLYADDTQLYMPIDRDNPAEAISTLEKCCLAIKTWMSTHLLKLNDAKTEVLLLGSQTQLKNVNFPSLIIGESQVPVTKSGSIRNLGVFFDSTLSMKTHVVKTCQSAHFHLRNIGRLRKLIDMDTTKMLIHSLVINRLDYCNSLMLGIPSNTIDRLQKIQNKAARIVTLSKPRDHITPVLKSLHWLPINKRIEFKIACVIFKCLHNDTPHYLSELVHRYVPVRPLRSEHQLRVIVPTQRLSLSDQSFAIGGAKIWNSLTFETKNSPNIRIFRGRLKTELFESFYN